MPPAQDIHEWLMRIKLQLSRALMHIHELRKQGQSRTEIDHTFNSIADLMGDWCAFTQTSTSLSPYQEAEHLGRFLANYANPLDDLHEGIVDYTDLMNAFLQEPRKRLSGGKQSQQNNFCWVLRRTTAGLRVVLDERMAAVTAGKNVAANSDNLGARDEDQQRQEAAAALLEMAGVSKAPIVLRMPKHRPDNWFHERRKRTPSLPIDWRPRE